MQISQAVAVVLNHGPHALGHIAIGIHVEQDRAGVADKRVGPGRGNKRAEQTGGRIRQHPANQQPNAKPTITTIETAVSASTWTTAARRLLSRCAAW